MFFIALFGYILLALPCLCDFLLRLRPSTHLHVADSTWPYICYCVVALIVTALNVDTQFNASHHKFIRHRCETRANIYMYA